MKYAIMLIIVILIIVISFLYVFNIKKESFQNYSFNQIPKIIISTYHTKKKIPKKVYTNIQKYAPNYKHIIFDDNDIINFLNKHYDHDIVNAFNKLNGAHKADLFRYCYLYKFGGVYLDIKTELIKDIDTIFNKKNVQFYTVLSGSLNYPNTIYQGVIATIPNNHFFIDLIKYMVNIEKPVRYYQTFTKDFYKRLEKEYKQKLKPGFFKGRLNLYLFYEKTSYNPKDCYDGLDRYRRCCFIYDKNKIIKVRYSDYPW